MRRARHILPRGRALLLTLVVIVLGPPVLLGLILLATLAPGVTVEIDVAMVTFAVAAVFAAVTIFILVRHGQRPRQSVSVNYNFWLIQSALPMGRYTFRLEVFYELVEKGERHTQRKGTIELKFRARDHPEFLRSCSARVRSHLDEHARLAAERYPEHEVVVSPEPTPDQVEARVAP